MASRYAAFCTNTIPICGSSYTNRTHSARPPHHHGRTPNSAYTKTSCIFTIRQNSGAANIQTNWSGAQSKMCSMHEDSQQSVPPTFHIHIYMRMRQSGRGSLTHIQPNTNIYGIYCSRWKYEKTEKKTQGIIRQRQQQQQ